MIKFHNNSDTPIMIFQEFHDKSLSLSQQNIDAACLSTFNLINNEISSRFVNIKYI